MRLYLSLILLLPLLGSLINIVIGRSLPRKVSEWLACGVIWGAFGFTVAAFAGYRGPVTVELAPWLASFDFKAPLSLYLDPLSLVMITMITFVCGLIHVYSVGYIAEETDYVRYFALLNLFVFAMLLLVLAENLPLLYLGWEGVGFCSYALIGFWYQVESNATAGRKAFIVTRIGDIAFAIGIIWMFRLFQTVSIPELNRMAFLMPGSIITILGLLLLGGAMGKSAQVPLMVWLPDAMAGPTPVSAQIHAATMVTAGVYLLARMFPLIGTSATVAAAIALTGGVTAFYAATCALAQRDLKRILAYSTISQIGYMTLGVGCGALSAATFHLLVHAFFKALLFLAAGCIITAMHHEQDIFKMGGLRRTIPLTFWTFLAGAVCLSGIPPTGGFFSKDAILAAAWDKGGALYGGLYILGLLTALLTAVYTFRMVYLVFGGSDRHTEHVPLTMALMLPPLALLGLAGGLLDLPSYIAPGWLDRFLGPLAGPHEAAPSMEAALQGVAAVIAFAGLMIAHFRYGGARRAEAVSAANRPSALTTFLLKGWQIDALYRMVFIRPFEALSRFFWQKVDEGVIDDTLDRVADFAATAGRSLGRWTCGRVSVYLLSFAAGLAAMLGYLAWLAWRA